MTDQTESDTDLNCEHLVRARDCPICFAALLRDLDSAAAGIQRLDRLDAESAAKAIRALEAELAFYKQAHGTDGKSAYWQEIAKVFADRDRLAEQTALLEQHIGLLKAENANYLIGRDRIAAELRGTQTRLSEMAGEVERLKADVLRQMAWKTEAQDELEDICNELPGVAFMDPPDGGSVSIAEQVKRMYAALLARDSSVQELLKYVKHNYGCGAITWREGAEHCTCGLSELLAACERRTS